MASFALKLIGGLVACVIVIVLAIVIFTDVWSDVGLIAAIVVISLPLLFWAWRVDRRDKARRQGLEDI